VTEPHNPLAKINLARSIEAEILERPVEDLATLATFEGAGVYAIYYRGNLDIYQPLTRSLTSTRPRPIYVGKAIPAGGRIGGLNLGTVRTTALIQRLRKHASSISQTEDLSVADFVVRYLVLDEVWIPLGENMLIEQYRPVWNRVLAGFGNNPPGAGRANQKLSFWDILHPGRTSTASAMQPVSRDELRRRVTDFLLGKPVPENPEGEQATTEN
jgi:hypothetical protein